MNTTLRIDPKKKYLAHLAARSRGVTFAALIDELIEIYLGSTELEDNGKEIAMLMLADELWSDDEATRIALIGNRFPELLTTRERVLWERIICEQQVYWKVPLNGERIAVNEATFEFELFRRQLRKYEDLTRDEIVSTANQLAKQRKKASSWQKK